jgi:hypothetical protein
MTCAESPTISPNNVRDAFPVEQEASELIQELGTFRRLVMQWSYERYVYFIRAGDGDGPIKIGIAYAPRKRMQELQTTSPDKLVLLATIPGDYGHEHHLHRTFAADRLRGEWFGQSPLLLALIQAALDRYGPPFDQRKRMPTKRAYRVAL